LRKALQIFYACILLLVTITFLYENKTTIPNFCCLSQKANPNSLLTITKENNIEITHPKPFSSCDKNEVHLKWTYSVESGVKSLYLTVVQYPRQENFAETTVFEGEIEEPERRQIKIVGLALGAAFIWLDLTTTDDITKQDFVAVNVDGDSEAYNPRIQDVNRRNRLYSLIIIIVPVTYFIVRKRRTKVRG